MPLNAAGFDGKSAGAIGFSYNFTDNVRLSIIYGQDRTQNVVSGGLSLSFHLDDDNMFVTELPREETHLLPNPNCSCSSSKYLVRLRPTASSFPYAFSKNL